MWEFLYILYCYWCIVIDGLCCAISKTMFLCMNVWIDGKNSLNGALNAFKGYVISFMFSEWVRCIPFGIGYTVWYTNGVSCTILCDVQYIIHLTKNRCYLPIFSCTVQNYSHCNNILSRYYINITSCSIQNYVKSYYPQFTYLCNNLYYLQHM